MIFLSVSLHFSQQSVPASAALPFLTATTQSSEYMELQVEYWTLTSKTETGDKDRINKKESSKCSLKTAFRSLHVYRLPPTPSETPVSAGFCMGVVTKEKKQKSKHIFIYHTITAIVVDIMLTIIEKFYFFC